MKTGEYDYYQLPLNGILQLGRKQHQGLKMLFATFVIRVAW
jgi:hypothetical protein